MLKIYLYFFYLHINFIFQKLLGSIYNLFLVNILDKNFNKIFYNK